MAKIFLFWILTTVLLTTAPPAQAQKPYRIGVVFPGGPLAGAIEGFRDGLKELGLEEGKQILLTIRDTKSDPKTAEEAARNFEKDKVNLIFALATPVISAAKAATVNTPIVFIIGSDPVAGGLVESFAKPGGRLTGIHFLVRDLTGKRLEILKELLPKLARVVTFYDPSNRVAADGAKLARAAGQQLGIKLMERHAATVEELRKGLQELNAGDADAFLFTPDPRIGAQAQLIIDVAKAKKIPTMFHEQSLVTQGALASYGQNYHEIGRLSARYAQKILGGTSPKDLRIETVDNVELAINLQTAKQLGLKIPPNMLARAKKVIK